jgi:hypothetical protein
MYTESVEQESCLRILGLKHSCNSTRRPCYTPSRTIEYHQSPHGSDSDNMLGVAGTTVSVPPFIKFSQARSGKHRRFLMCPFLTFRMGVTTYEISTARR